MSNIQTPGIDFATIAPKRSVLVKVATFGDSTANQGYGSWDTDSYTAVFPASGANSINFYSNKFQLPMYYPRCKLVANGGITGENTTQMLARDTAAGSATRKAITDVLSVNPHVTFLHGGSINDFVTVTSGTLAAAVATAYANHVEAINRLLSGGGVVVDVGIPGFANGSANTATDLPSCLSAIVQVNALYKAFAATLPGKVYFIDPVATGLSDGTGAYLANISNDGTHLSFYGAALQAAAEAAILTTLFGPSVGPRFDGTNIVSNPLWANTGSQSYGVVPTGCSAGFSNTTRQNSKVEVIDGKKFWTIEHVPTSAGCQALMGMPFDPTAMSISVNDIYGFEFDMMLDGVTLQTTPILTNLLGRVDITKTANGRVVLDFGAPTTFPIKALPNGSFRRHIQIGPFKFSEASAALAASPTNFTLTIGTNDTDTFKVGVANPRIVKLGQAVVTN